MQKPEVIPPLVIRADAGAQIGLGHVTRCLALAEWWRGRGGEVVLARAFCPAALEERWRGLQIELTRIKSSPGSLEDAAELVETAREHASARVVIDGYVFGGEYQRALKKAGLRVLALDDYGHAGHYWADWVLNQNLGASAELYSSRESHTQLLLGSRFVQLRQEFLPWQKWRRKTPGVARKVLVTLGGSDPANFTRTVIVALTKLEEDLEAVALVGAGNAHRESLERMASKTKGRVRIEFNPGEVARWMAWADVAVAGAGTTAWELAFMGLPSVMVCLAENQRGAARLLDEGGLVELAGWHSEVSATQLGTRLRQLLTNPRRRREMSRRGRELVDGAGGSRVGSALLSG